MFFFTYQFSYLISAYEPNQGKIIHGQHPGEIPLYLHYYQRVWLRLHGAIYRPDSFVMMLCYCANLKAIRYESTSLNKVVTDKSHRVIVA